MPDETPAADAVLVRGPLSDDSPGRGLSRDDAGNPSGVTEVSCHPETLHTYDRNGFVGRILNVYDLIMCFSGAAFKTSPPSRGISGPFMVRGGGSDEDAELAPTEISV